MVNENIEINSKFLEPFMNLISKLFSQEDQKILKNAANAFKDGNYHSAVKEYRKCVNILGRINLNNNQPSQADVVIRYILSKCLLQSSHFEDFLEARTILTDLDKSVGRTYPMIYHDLAEFYVKLFCFDEAERIIAKCLSVLREKKKMLICFLPGSNDIIPESTKQDLLVKLLNLREQCSGWHPPDAKCFMDNCAMISPNYLCGKNIFIKSPAFNGMVTLTCSNVINPCTITFHSACWKVKKNEISSGMKISDKEILLNWQCFTPNCGDEDELSLIKKIVVHKEDDTVKSIEPSVERSIWHAQQQNFAPKGAIRKRKLSSNSNAQVSKMKYSSIVSKIPQNQEQIKHEAEIEILKEDSLDPKLVKLMNLRDHNFGRNSWTDWRPDRSNYGNRRQRRNVKLKWPLSPEDTKELVQLKNFLYSYFYQYLMKNGPVKEEIFVQKWIETTKVISNCQSVIDNLTCTETVKNFFLESIHFTMIGKYFVVMPLLPGAYDIVNRETCDDIRYLLEHPQRNGEKKQRSKTFREDEATSIKVRANELKEQEEIVENSKPLPLNEQNDNSLILNVSSWNETNSVSPVSSSFENISLSDSLIEIDDNVIEKQKGIIENLQRNLSQTQAQLEYNKAQLLTMKRRMLQDSLDYQYIDKNIVLTCQKEKTQNELGIIEKIQTMLVNTIGTCLTLNLREWTDPIEELDNLKERLNAEYLILSSSIKCMNNYEDMDDVNSEPIKITSLPQRNVKSLIQIAAGKLQKFHEAKNLHQNPDSLPVTMQEWYQQTRFRTRHSTPPGFDPKSKKAKVPIYIPPPILRRMMSRYKKNAELKEGQFPLSGEHESGIDSQDTKSADRVTALSQDTETAQSSSCNADDDTNTKNIDSSNLHESSASEASTKNTIESNDSVSINRIQGNSKNPAQPRSPAFYRIMEIIRERHPDVDENDLILSVRMLREAHGRTFKGLGLARIIKEVDAIIDNKKQKLNIESKPQTITATGSPSLLALGRSRNHSVSSSSSGSPSTKELAPRPNPWKIIPQPDVRGCETPRNYNEFPNVVQQKISKKKANPWETPKELSWKKECLENECVICIEAFIDDTTNPTYTLKCQHTFHETCIRNWFTLNRSCPTCRVHSTIDAEFPPLP